MSIQAIRNTRIQVADYTAKAEVAAANDQAAAEAALDEQFAASSNEPQLQSTDSLQGFLLGDTQAQAAEVNSGDAFDNAMASGDFPPSLDEILVNSPSTANYLDIVTAKYEKTIEKLEEMKSLALEALQTGRVSPQEASKLQARLHLIEGAISKAQQQITLAQQRMSSNEELYARERLTGEDANNDGWIGRPNSDLSVRVITNHEGKKVYLDPKIDKVIRNPFLASNYQAQMTFGDGLQITEDNKPIDTTNEELFADGKYKDKSRKADLYLQVNPGHENEQYFDATSVMGVPEFLWVKREDGSYDAKIDNENGSRFELYNKFKDENGLVQEMPEDKKEWTQVKVTEVKVTAEESGKTIADDPNGKVYHHVVEYYGTVDGQQVLIARVRIEGVAASGNNNDASYATPIEGGQNYIAASTLGFTLTGNPGVNAGGRVSQVKIDLSEMESTGDHKIDNLAQKLGMTPPSGFSNEQEDLIEGPSEQSRANEAWNENINQFSQKEQSHTFYLTVKEIAEILAPGFEAPAGVEYTANFNGAQSVTGSIQEIARWIKEKYADIPDIQNDEGTAISFEDNANGLIPIKVTASRDLANSYTSSDRYVSNADDAEFAAALHSPVKQQRSGAVVSGLTGQITGSKYRDVFDIPDHDRDFKNEPQFSGLSETFGEKPRPTDVEFNTTIEGGDGYDIVRAGNGNIIARDITFFWQDNVAGAHSIVQMEAGHGSKDGLPDAQSDIKTFVHQRGGKIDILNSLEIGSGEEQKSPYYQYAIRNDFYDVQHAEFGNLADADVPEDMKSGSGFDESHITEALNAIEQDFETALFGLPELDQADAAQAATDWGNTHGKNYTEMENELNQFFGESFGFGEEDEANLEEAAMVEEAQALGEG